MTTKPSRAVVPRIRLEPELELPDDVPAADLADVRPAHGLEHLDHGREAGVVGRHELDRARGLTVEPRRLGVEAPGRLTTAHPIAEPPVDRVLGRVQEADDVAALAHRRVLGRGQPSQDPAPSMGREDADDRRWPMRGLPAAGDRQLRLERSERGDDLSTRRSRPCSGEVPLRADGRRHSGEVLRTLVERRRPGVEIVDQLVGPDGPDVDAHGADDSIRAPANDLTGAG